MGGCIKKQLDGKKQKLMIKKHLMVRERSIAEATAKKQSLIIKKRKLKFKKQHQMGSSYLLSPIPMLLSCPILSQ